MRADCLNGTLMRSPPGSNLGGQFEVDVLVCDGALADRGPTETVERADDVLDESLGRGGAGAQSDARRADEKVGRDVGAILDEARRAAGALGDLDESARVGGVTGPHDEHYVALRRHRPHRVLSVLGRVADVPRG